ncbi:hypothetical protein EJB05_08322, partial [Eragrostis curvula]
MIAGCFYSSLILVGIIAEVVLCFLFQKQNCKVKLCSSHFMPLIGGIPMAMPVFLYLALVLGSLRFRFLGIAGRGTVALEDLASMDVMFFNMTSTLTCNKPCFGQNKMVIHDLGGCRLLETLRGLVHADIFCIRKHEGIWWLDVDLSDERDADGGDDEGGGDAENEVVPEGEIVGVARRPASLLAHDQVRRRPQQRQVAGHRAHPCKQQPRLDHGRRRYQRRRRGHLAAHQQHCTKLARLERRRMMMERTEMPPTLLTLEYGAMKFQMAPGSPVLLNPLTVMNMPEKKTSSE